MAPNDDIVSAGGPPTGGHPTGEPAGNPFPSEQEWLDLRMPEGSGSEAESAESFVERTLQALQRERLVEVPSDDALQAASIAADSAIPLPDVWAAFTSPEPSTDFVARTMTALRHDQRARWREMLARHSAPQPSPQFVARTLAALATDRLAESAAATLAQEPLREGNRNGRRGPRRGIWAWPLLTLAAAALVWVALPWISPSGTSHAPLELRLARAESPAFAHAYATTPLPAVLTALAQSSDPLALPSGGVDGAWLLLGRDR